MGLVECYIITLRDCESSRLCVARPYPLSSICFTYVNLLFIPLHLCHTRLDCSPVFPYAVTFVQHM